MSSEIRVNKITNRIGLSTVTFADSGIGVTVTGRIDPDTDSARDLGTTSVRWRNVYADTLYGDGSNLTGISAGISLANGADNRVVTATGANAITGETNLTFDGTLAVIGGSQNTRLSANILWFDRAGYSYIDQINDSGSLVFRVTSGYTHALRLDSSAQAHFGADLYIPNSIVHVGDTDTKIRFNNNEIDFEAAGSSRFKITQYATYVQAGYPLAFLASTGPSPSIKSGGTNNQDLLLTTGSGNPTRLEIASNGESTFKQKLKVDYQVSGSDYCAYFRNQNANSYGVWISEPASVNVGYPLLAVGNSSGGSHFRVDSGGLVYANSGTGTEKPAYFCRAWANLSGDSSPATIRVSKGIGGFTDLGVGDYRFEFASALPDANYSALCSSAGDGGWSMVPHIYSHSDMTTTTVRFSINAVNMSGQNYDRDIFCMAVFR